MRKKKAFNVYRAVALEDIEEGLFLNSWRTEIVEEGSLFISKVSALEDIKRLEKKYTGREYRVILETLDVFEQVRNYG